MKKNSLFILILLVFIGGNAKAQTINNVPIKDIENKYIEIVANFGRGTVMNSFTLDLGQTNRIFTARDLQLRDQNGMLLKFTSIVDLLNYFAKNGYELANTYTLAGNQYECHYVLKRNR
ncbi:MAG: hypothetical protein CFE21_04280 [Bacteroidetes bacterium B1(2017)]|nr:MAG: hypothetical protein CFE21_04280 [Bacteroidetes bacterium B1(2017)]